MQIGTIIEKLRDNDIAGLQREMNTAARGPVSAPGKRAFEKARATLMLGIGEQEGVRNEVCLAILLAPSMLPNQELDFDKPWRTLTDIGADQGAARKVATLLSAVDRISGLQRMSVNDIRAFTRSGAGWGEVFALHSAMYPSQSMDRRREEGEEVIRAVSDMAGRDLWGPQPEVGRAPPKDARGHLMLVCGLPGAGKSTITKDLDGTVLGYDTVRAAIPNYKRNPNNEKLVMSAALGQLREALAAGESVIWDATGVSRNARKLPRKVAYECAARVSAISLDVPFSLAAQRNAGREKPVPADNMRNLADQRQMIMVSECSNLISVDARGEPHRLFSAAQRRPAFEVGDALSF